MYVKLNEYKQTLFLVFKIGKPNLRLSLLFVSEVNLNKSKLKTRKKFTFIQLYKHVQFFCELPVIELCQEKNNEPDAFKIKHKMFFI